MPLPKACWLIGLHTHWWGNKWFAQQPIVYNTPCTDEVKMTAYPGHKSNLTKKSCSLLGLRMKFLHEVVKHAMLLLRLALSLLNVSNKIIILYKSIYCVLSHRNMQMIWGKLCHQQSNHLHNCSPLHIPNINLTNTLTCHQIWWLEIVYLKFSREYLSLNVTKHVLTWII